MSSEICTCEWGIDVFYNGIPTYSARVILWELYKTKRDGMRSRGSNININDGNSLYRICITMRTNEFLRSNGNNEFNISDTVYRGGRSTMSMRGV